MHYWSCTTHVTTLPHLILWCFNNPSTDTLCFIPPVIHLFLLLLLVITMVGYGTTPAEGELIPGSNNDEDDTARPLVVPGGLDYWLVKNSYGAQFGEKGFFRVKRNDTACPPNGGLGILSAPVYPVIKKV